jgi:hypothetical protein
MQTKPGEPEKIFLISQVVEGQGLHIEKEDDGQTKEDEGQTKEDAHIQEQREAQIKESQMWTIVKVTPNFLTSMKAQATQETVVAILGYN